MRCAWQKILDQFHYINVTIIAVNDLLSLGGVLDAWGVGGACGLLDGGTSYVTPQARRLPQPYYNANQAVPLEWADFGRRMYKHTSLSYTHSQAARGGADDGDR
jgi:hypothetical protein